MTEEGGTGQMLAISPTCGEESHMAKISQEQTHIPLWIVTGEISMIFQAPWHKMNIMLLYILNYSSGKSF